MAIASGKSSGASARSVDRQGDEGDGAGRRLEDAARAGRARSQARPYAEKMLEVLGDLGEAARRRGRARTRSSTGGRRDIADPVPRREPRPGRRPHVEHEPPCRRLRARSRRRRSSVRHRRAQGARLHRRARARRSSPTSCDGRLPGVGRHAAPIARHRWTSTRAGSVDRVFMLYPRFVNTAVQTPDRAAAPADRAGGASGRRRHDVDYIFEPSCRSRACEQLLPRYVEMPIYQADPRGRGERTLGADGRDAQRDGRRATT